MKLIALNSNRVGEWAASKLGGVWSEKTASAHGLVESTELAEDGEPKILAAYLVSDWNGASCQLHVAGEGRTWLNRPFLWSAFNYTFNQLGVKKVIGLVGEGNLEARRFDEHLGFREACRLEDCHPSGDLIIYSMTREQCRWLKLFTELKPENYYYG